MKKNYFISINSSIKKSIQQMKFEGVKSLYIINDKKKLLGSISDGDLRSAILKKKKLNYKIRDLINYNPKYIIKTRHELDKIKIRKLFDRYKVDSLPILNKKKKILNIVSWSNFYNSKIKKKK